MVLGIISRTVESDMLNVLVDVHNLLFLHSCVHWYKQKRRRAHINLLCVLVTEPGIHQGL